MVPLRQFGPPSGHGAPASRPAVMQARPIGPMHGQVRPPHQMIRPVLRHPAPRPRLPMSGMEPGYPVYTDHQYPGPELAEGPYGFEEELPAEAYGGYGDEGYGDGQMLNYPLDQGTQPQHFGGAGAPGYDESSLYVEDELMEQIPYEDYHAADKCVEYHPPPRSLESSARMSQDLPSAAGGPSNAAWSSSYRDQDQSENDFNPPPAPPPIHQRPSIAAPSATPDRRHSEENFFTDDHVADASLESSYTSFSNEDSFYPSAPAHVSS